MTRRLTVASAIVLASAGITAVGAQRVPAIAWDVMVQDAAGQSIAGLGSDDFEVLSDGARVPSVQVSPAPPAVSVVLLIDATTSQPLKRYEIQAAVSTTWVMSLDSGDRARIGTIGSPAAIGPWLPAGAASQNGVGRLAIERAAIEPSPIWDSVAAGIEALAGSPGAKAVLLLTDGRSAGNKSGVDDVAEMALAADVTISSVSEGWDWLALQPNETSRDRPDTSLKHLADVTGGLFLEDAIARRISPRVDPLAYVRDVSRSPNQPGPLLARIMTALHQRYRLTMPASADGHLHMLEVRVNRPGAVVSSRTRYVLRAGSSAHPIPR